MTAQPLFDEAAERMLAEDPSLESARMFASEGLKTSGKFFAMVSRGDLVLKLPEDRVEELIAGGTAGAFEMGIRRMREWVRVTPADAKTCEALMMEARDFVQGLQASNT